MRRFEKIYFCILFSEKVEMWCEAAFAGLVFCRVAVGSFHFLTFPRLMSARYLVADGFN